MSIKVTLNQDITTRGTGPFTYSEFRFKSGQEVNIARVEWPGKPNRLYPSLYAKAWVFYTDTDRLGPKIKAEQIESLTCPGIPEWREVFKDAPFKVIYQTHVVQKDLIIRFGRWLAGTKGSDVASAHYLISCAQNEADFIGVILQSAIDLSDLSLHRLEIRKRMLEYGFTKEEIDHVLAIPLDGPYEWV